VLLGVPFECMLGEVILPEAGRANQVVRPAGVDESALNDVVSLLLGAERPVVVTEHAGRDPRAVGALVELCEAIGIPVMESYRPAFLNFPRNHPLYLPFDPKRVADADLVLVVDAVSPWYPLNNGPKPGARVVFLGDEYPYSRLPFWGYKVDLALVAAPAASLEGIVRRLKASAAFGAGRPKYEARFQK